MPDGVSGPPEVIEELRPTRWPVALRSLRYRDFRLFWIGMVISVIGTWMQNAAQGWLVLELTNSALYLGIVGACGSLPMLLFALPAGVVADRCVKQHVLLVTQTLSMLQAFVLAALVHAGTVQVWHVMLLAACLGSVNAFDMPTRQAMVMDLAGRDDILNAVSLNSLAFNSGRTIGPAVGGVLVAGVGMAGCFFINGLTFLAVIIALLLIPARAPGGAVQAPFVTEMKGGLSWVRRNPIAMWLIALTAMSSLFAMPYTTLMPVFARDILHAGPRGFGLMLSATGAGALVTGIVLTSQGHRFRLGALATAGSLAFPLGLMAVSFAPRFAIALVALFLTGLGMMLFNVVSNTMLQKAPPDELRGRVMSVRTFFFAGLGPAGNLQIGAAGQWLGPRWAIAFGGVVCFLMAAVAWLRAPNLRQSK